MTFEKDLNVDDDIVEDNDNSEFESDNDNDGAVNVTKKPRMNKHRIKEVNKDIKETKIVVLCAAKDAKDMVSQYKSLCPVLQLLLPHSFFLNQHSPLQTSTSCQELREQCCSTGHRLLYWEILLSPLPPWQHARPLSLSL